MSILFIAKIQNIGRIMSVVLLFCFDFSKITVILESQFSPSTVQAKDQTQLAGHQTFTC